MIKYAKIQKTLQNKFLQLQYRVYMAKKLLEIVDFRQKLNSIKNSQSLRHPKHKISSYNLDTTHLILLARHYFKSKFLKFKQIIFEVYKVAFLIGC